ncbi:response regulator [Palleronia rufa]|uniref:response regulator n=1 Tax=Palleronia rufa TaxID=1530186 RepID=UPI00068A0944|nr:response regulator transcription factor [Palleronia rufa]
MNDPSTATLRGVSDVLIVDDHPLFAEALALAVEEACDPCRTVIATNVSDALDLLGRDPPHQLILLDLNLPDSEKLSAFDRIRDAAPGLPILVVSAWATEETIARLIAKGAAGFMRKEDSADVLHTAMAHVLNGRVFTSGAPRVAPQDAEAGDLAERLAGLTRQQARIMKLICDGKPNKQIAYEMSLAEASVKAHVTALLRRLGVRTRTQVAVLARAAGEDEDPPRIAAG